MREMDARDKEEAKPGELGKEELKKVLDYLERRKVQLINALKKIEESGGNQICTTDPECRVMKTRDGIRPSYNVQTAVEVDNHFIVHYDVTDECVDWNLLKAGIDASKEALGVKNIEGIADRGYSNHFRICRAAYAFMFILCPASGQTMLTNQRTPLQPFDASSVWQQGCI